MDVPDAPIAGGIDNANMIILSQEGRYLCINRASVPELCKLLKLLRLLRRSDDQAQKKRGRCVSQSMSLGRKKGK